MVWQFCRFIDNKLKTNYANDYLDLVALGLCGDMMSLRSFETRYLITEGFKINNIKNPFIEGMIEKNEFPLSKADYISADESMACTSMGAAFFIVPFVNALTRSGTQTEKELLFKSMLDNYAFTKILSNKRGHKEGEQALLEAKIKENCLLQHKILLFLLKENEIEPNIRGLVANKMMAKYQRPCLVLSYSPEKRIYEGSGRGYTKTGIDSFKDILKKSGAVAYAQGHDNAMGCGIPEEQIPIFIAETDKILENISTEPVYRVDYELFENNDNAQLILDIGNMNDYWGQDIDRAYVNINFKMTNQNIALMKSNTFKITLPYNTSIIKFNITEEELTKFSEILNKHPYIEMNAICKCAVNKWNGNSYPQLIVQDWEIIDSPEYATFQKYSFESF